MSVLTTHSALILFHHKMFRKTSPKSLKDPLKNERIKCIEKLKQEIKANMKPFSFYDKDEHNSKECLQITCEPPQFTPFKANPIKWKSQVNVYEDMMEHVEKEIEERRRKRAQDILNAVKLPPRMEMIIVCKC